jgi:peptidyl-tRNA hydrolase, PTH2 family
MSNVKQVIVMRKDLKMRKGKMIAQGAHASMKVILNTARRKIVAHVTGVQHIHSVEYEKDSPMDEWLNGLFTKVCLSVDSEAELLKLYEQAKALDLPCALITDAGKTEFNGVPTNTCIAIGPALSEQIDVITGELKLL